MGVIIKFKDHKDDCTLEVKAEGLKNIVSISIEMQSENIFESVWMDVDTAVKFSKELRKQIAIAKDFELKSEDNE